MALTAAEYRAKDPARYRSYTAKYRETHRAQEQARSRAKYAEKKKDLEFQERRRNLRALHFRALRKQVEDLLGSLCCRCGFADRRALQIDHINGDGAEQRRKKCAQGSSRLNQLLQDPQLKENYQLLCANCNWIKRVENKECIMREVPDVV